MFPAVSCFRPQDPELRVHLLRFHPHDPPGIIVSLSRTTPSGTMSPTDDHLMFCSVLHVRFYSAASISSLANGSINFLSGVTASTFPSFSTPCGFDLLRLPLVHLVSPGVTLPRLIQFQVDYVYRLQGNRLCPDNPCVAGPLVFHDCAQLMLAVLQIPSITIDGFLDAMTRSLSSICRG